MLHIHVEIFFYFFLVSFFFAFLDRLSVTFSMCSVLYILSRAMAKMDNSMSLWNTELTMIKSLALVIL